MWPLDRLSATEYLRVGRHSVERWVGSSSTLSRVGSRALTTTSGLDPDGLVPVIRALYPNKPQSAVTILLESVWLPLLLLEVGPALWTSAQVEPLLRHRLNMLHGVPSASTPGWDICVDYRAGERLALGYGMPSRLRQLLMEVGDATGLQWAALLPSFAWGLQRLRPARHWPGRSGWWVWPEQDRLLLTRIASSRIVALNTGTAFTDDPAQITRLVDVESLRSGSAVRAEPIGAATWVQARHPAVQADRLSWMAIAGRSHPPASDTLLSSSPSTVRP